MHHDRRRRQLALLLLRRQQDEARQQEDDDESASRSGEPNDGADGRVVDGEGDADADDAQVDHGYVKDFLLLATNDQQESLEHE